MGTLRLKAPPPPEVLAAVARAAGDSARVAPPPPPPPLARPPVPKPAAPPLTKAEAKARERQLHASRMATKAVRLPIVANQVWWNTKFEMARAAEQQAAWRVADLARCRELFPLAFDADTPLPLAVGAHKLLAPVIGTKRAERLLAWWVDSPAYVAAIAAGGCRHRLDGAVSGEISDAHRRAAQARIDGRKIAA